MRMVTLLRKRHSYRILVLPQSFRQNGCHLGFVSKKDVIGSSRQNPNPGGILYGTADHSSGAQPSFL